MGEGGSVGLGEGKVGQGGGERRIEVIVEMLKKSGGGPGQIRGVREDVNEELK